MVSDRTVRGQASPSGFGGSAFLAGAFFVAFCAAVFLAAGLLRGRLLRRRLGLLRRALGGGLGRRLLGRCRRLLRRGLRGRGRAGRFVGDHPVGAGGGGGWRGSRRGRRTHRDAVARARRRRRSGRGRRVVGCGRAQRTQHGLHCDAEQDEKPQSAEESTAHDHEANPRADVRPGPCPSPRRTGRPDGVAVGQADVRGARLDAGRRVSAALRNAPAHRRPPSYLRRAPHIGARQPPAPSRPGGF